MQLHTLNLDSSLVYCADIQVRQSDGMVIAACLNNSGKIVLLSVNPTTLKQTLSSSLSPGPSQQVQGLDSVRSLDIDQVTGEVYVVGHTFNPPGGAGTQNLNGQLDIVLIKVSPMLALNFSTYIGFKQSDMAFSVAVHPTRNLVFIGGATNSRNWLSNTREPTQTDFDAIILTLTKNGDALWSKSFYTLGDDYGFNVEIIGNQDQVVLAGNPSFIANCFINGTVADVVTTRQVPVSGTYANDLYYSGQISRLNANGTYDLSIDRYSSVGGLQADALITVPSYMLVADILIDNKSNRFALVGYKETSPIQLDLYQQIVQRGLYYTLNQGIFNGGNSGLQVFTVDSTSFYGSVIDINSTVWITGKTSQGAYLSFDNSTFRVPVLSTTTSSRTTSTSTLGRTSTTLSKSSTTTSSITSSSLVKTSTSSTQASTTPVSQSGSTTTVTSIISSNMASNSVTSTSFTVTLSPNIIGTMSTTRDLSSSAMSSTALSAFLPQTSIVMLDKLSTRNILPEQTISFQNSIQGQEDVIKFRYFDFTQYQQTQTQVETKLPINVFQQQVAGIQIQWIIVVAVLVLVVSVASTIAVIIKYRRRLNTKTILLPADIEQTDMLSRTIQIASTAMVTSLTAPVNTQTLPMDRTDQQ